MAAMLRADLAAARAAWLKASQDADERQEREESDFLLETNHDGGRLDFHDLRHTCGAWLARAGVHPKVVQAIMRHSTIVLTMDTYGHLFPSDEAEAVSKIGNLLAGVSRAFDVEPAATALHLAQQLGRGTIQSESSQCANDDTSETSHDGRNSLVARGYAT